MSSVQIFELKNGSYVKSQRNSTHSSIEKALSNKKQLYSHIRCHQIYPRKSVSQKQIFYHKVRVLRSEHESDIQTTQSTSRIVRLSCKIKQSQQYSEKVQTPKTIKGVKVIRFDGEQSVKETAKKMVQKTKLKYSTVDIKNRIIGNKIIQLRTSQKQDKQQQFKSPIKRKKIKVRDFFDSVRKQNERINSEIPINISQQKQIKRISIPIRKSNSNSSKAAKCVEQKSIKILSKDQSIQKNYSLNGQYSNFQQNLLIKQNQAKIRLKEQQIIQYRQMIQKSKANQSQLQEKIKNQRNRRKNNIIIKKLPKQQSNMALNQNLIAFTTLMTLVCQQFIRTQAKKDKA